MQYRLRWSERSLRRLRTLPEWLRREILLIVQALRSDPYPPTANPLLRELEGYWKLKVNGYRVIYLATMTIR